MLKLRKLYLSLTRRQIESGEISGTITIQLQDENGNSQQTLETIDIEFLSTSALGEFLSPSSENSVTKTMASGTANKNFRYRDSAEGEFTLTVNATGRDSGDMWSVSQIITVETSVPPLPVTIIPGPITEDTTWSPDGGVYMINSHFSVAEGITLTIEPGTIIKAKTTALGGPSIYGVLIANGTSEQPIYFTSRFDDSVGGDSDGGGPSVGEPGQWQGLYFKPGSVGEFDNVTIRYAGDGGYGWGNFVGIENDGGILSIKNSLIDQNNMHGIWQKDGDLTIENSILSNQVFGLMTQGGETMASSNEFRANTNYGVHASMGGSLELTDNNFIDNAKTAYVAAQVDFSHTGNTSADTANRGFEITGNINDDTTWHTDDLPIIIPNGGFVIVATSGTLNI
ncbi:MAG: hypothetical protein COX06_02290, partial [Candidatus Zambryskibacteria bacterium CG22_combo_CG10-13_8_21_14_all_42_17]